MSTNKMPVFTFVLTWQEYNYVVSSLRARIRERNAGDQGGNVPYLIAFLEKTLRKIERAQEAQLRKHVGEKEWKKQRRFINGLIRKSLREAHEAER